MQDEVKDVPQYIVQEKSLIGNDLHEAGAKVPYDGLPADNLLPTCDEGRRRRQLYIESNAERVRKMQAQFAESGVGDPTKFMAAFAEQLKKDSAERDEKLAGMIGAAVGTAVAEAFAAAMARATAAPPVDAAADPKATKGKDKSGESLV